MEITTTITTAPYAVAAADAQPRLAMPSAAAFGGARVWSAVKRNHNHKHVAVAGNVPGVQVWSPPHC
ncbi:hypothetical protein [Nocardioides jejuensis]|uniref:Uncharacterized protein n=1 Tax=Nocardioides jejuensis TaxID=2502782 RepID=A0A4R1CL98_9ACTN|nr:hypothetical protein [Nocardioides jejuensis]TCJ31235.1 hypothetical protein EPD65_01295 [Nocardioides jejuensis]